MTVNSTFTLGGRTARDLGMVMLRTSQRPGMPGTSDRTMSIPGRHGAWDFGADLNGRLFVLECAFVTRDPIQLQQRISELAHHLTDISGRPREMRLILSIQPDRFYRVRYSGALPVERVAGLGQFSLPLMAFDPMAYSVQEHIYETDITESPYEIELESVGNVRTPPVIEIINEGETTITNFRIINEYRTE